MASVMSAPSSISDPPRQPLPTVAPSTTPPDTCPVCPRIGSEFGPWCQAAYYHAMHRRACAREQRLKRRVQDLQAEVRLLKQKVFGKSAEAGCPGPDTAPAPPDAPTAPPPTKRPRGQQPGRPSPPRRDHDHLPAVEEIRDLSDADKLCPCCHKPFAPFPGTEDSEILEREVKAHRRVIPRRRYRPSCDCPNNKPVVVAPPAPRVTPKAHLGVSIGVAVRLDKYLFHRPTCRLLADLTTSGLDLSLGTITDGLKRLEPLFTPLYDAVVERSQERSFWHAGETRWQVYVTREGKVGHRWYVWVFHAPGCVAFVLSPTRAHEVPEGHFGEDGEGILVVDRYAAYQAMDAVADERIVLAFCWAHGRRDFPRVGKGHPAHADWAHEWVARIGTLYHLNHERCDALEALETPATSAAPPLAVPTPELADEPPPKPPAKPPGTPSQRQLQDHLTAMATQRDAELADPKLPPEKRKVLRSLAKHWAGLTVFVDHPEVPLDNNTAERSLRGPVVGRKNYSGSGSEWSGRLATMLWSPFQTLSLANLNPRAWLTAYLEGCAAAGGKAPSNAEEFLPWTMSAERKAEWGFDRAEPAAADSS